jgi:hypothetical protein
MPHSYDAASQYLASFEPSDWPAILGIETSATITPIVADLSTVSARADVILRINETAPWILVRKIMDLRDSTFIQHDARIGRKKGFQEGKLQGELEGKRIGELKAKREILLKLGTARFGAPSDTVQETIFSIEDGSRLDQLIELLIKATSWDELFPEPN